MPSLTLIGATSRPCGAKNLIFWPVSKFNTGSLIAALRHPAGNEAYDHF